MANNFLKPLLSILLIGCIVSGCEQGTSKSSKQQSPEEAERIRNGVNSSVELARNLNLRYPSHDLQYYLDKIAQAMEECKDNSDPGSCYEKKIERLMY
jgi:hypothetical protein